MKEEKNFYTTVTNIQRVKIWKMRNLTLEGKIVIFKTLAISKIESLITLIPRHVVNELEKIQNPAGLDGSQMHL